MPLNLLTSPNGPSAILPTWLLPGWSTFTHCKGTILPLCALNAVQVKLLCHPTPIPTLHFTVLHHTTLHCTVLHSTSLHCTGVVHCIAPISMVLYNTLDCTVSHSVDSTKLDCITHCTVLYHTLYSTSIANRG